MENNERSVRPRSRGTDENVEKVRNLVHSDRSLRIRTMAVKLNYTKSYVRRKRRELWPNDWILHRDNAPAHVALPVEQFRPKNRLLKWNAQPIPLIWLRMTSGRFQK
jgi:hypothetical protein